MPIRGQKQSAATSAQPPENEGRALHAIAEAYGRQTELLAGLAESTFGAVNLQDERLAGVSRQLSGLEGRRASRLEFTVERDKNGKMSKLIVDIAR